MGFNLEIKYMWTPIMLFDMEKITYKSSVNFDCGKFYLDGIFHSTSISIQESGLALDAGGRSHEWLMKSNPHVNWLNEGGLLESKENDILILKSNIYKFPHLEASFRNFQMLGDKFLHIRDASGWMTGSDPQNLRILKDSNMFQALNNTLDFLSQLTLRF